MILISLFAIFAIASSQLQKQSVCGKLETVYKSMCPNEGIKGNSHYERVEEMILRRLQEVLEEKSPKYSELLKLLTEANEKIKQLENKTDSCPVAGCRPMKYNGKYFWIEYRDPPITIVQARAICSAEGARLADIYSETHHYMLLGYLRLLVNHGGWANAWIGMSYNQTTNAVSLSDGTPAPFVMWHLGYPVRDLSSNMALAANRNPKREQHLWNPRLTGVISTVPGAICEK